MIIDGMIWNHNTQYGSGYEPYINYFPETGGTGLSGDGPVPAPLIATNFVVASSELLSTGAGRVTMRIEQQPMTASASFYLKDLGGIGPTVPFGIIADATTAGGDGFYCYLTRTTFEFPGLSVPLGFTIEDTPGFYFNYYYSYPLISIAMSDSGIGMSYYYKGGYNYDTGVWTVYTTGVAFKDHPDHLPYSLGKQTHMGVMAPKAGLRFASFSVEGTLYEAGFLQPRFEI